MFLLRNRKAFGLAQNLYYYGISSFQIRLHKSIFPVDDGAGQWPVGVGKGQFSPGFSGAHDVGGVDGLLKIPIDLSEKSLQLWERQTHAILVLLSGMDLVSVDELRRAVEGLHPQHYNSWTYYEKWAVAMSQILLENKVISFADLNGRDSLHPICSAPLYRKGDPVKVKNENILSRWRKPHLRTPGYIFGAAGKVERYCGQFSDPSFVAFQKLGKEKEKMEKEKQHLYRVRFKQNEVWEGYDASHNDTIDVEIYENWLEPLSRENIVRLNSASDIIKTDPINHEYKHSSLNQEPDHVHLSRIETEQNAVNLEGCETAGERLAKSLCQALVNNNVLTLPQINNAIERVDMLGKNGEGNKIVARAWVDTRFKQKLLDNASEACADLGISASNTTTSTVLTVVENTDDVHNLIVCTLCSCYPLTILGLSPPWYKSRGYRAQAVRKPRELLKNTFGLSIPSNVMIRVHDSTADLRYLVLPKRPEGTEKWTEEELQEIVTRDCLIGVATPKISDEEKYC